MPALLDLGKESPCVFRLKPGLTPACDRHWRSIIRFVEENPFLSDAAVARLLSTSPATVKTALAEYARRHLRGGAA